MPTTVEIKGELELYPRQLIDVRLYNNIDEAMRDSICHPMKEYKKKEIAVALYKAEKASLVKAAEISEVSFTNLKEILVEKGINPRLGAKSAEELRQDHLTLKSEVN